MEYVNIYLPIYLLTGYAAWQDYKTGEIDNWVSAAILLYGILVNAFLYPSRFFVSIWFLFTVGLFFVILFFVTYRKEGDEEFTAIGGGDVKLFAALSFFYGPKIILVVFLSSILGLIYGLIIGAKQKTYLRTNIRFAPAIFAAVILSNLPVLNQLFPFQ